MAEKDIKYVVGHTDFTRDTVKRFYEGAFLPLCRHGRMSERAFKQLFMQRHEDTGDDGSLYCFLSEVFDAMDVDKKGYITFRELMINLDQLCNADTNSILRKVFTIFDSRNAGKITQREIKSLFHCLRFVAIDDSEGGSSDSLQRMGRIADEVCRGRAGQGRILFERAYFTPDDFVSEFTRHTEERDLVLNAIRKCFGF